MLTFSRFLPYYVGDMKILNTLLQNGLTVRDGIVLIKLCSSDTFTPSLLVDEHFQKANITRIINKLRDKGLVAKESDLVDKRRLHILITHAGRKLING